MGSISEGPAPPVRSPTALPRIDLGARARELWRERHLDTRSLPPTVRWLVIAGLVACGLGALLILLTGQRVRLPGGRQQLTGFSVPRVLVPFCYAGLGAAAACLAAAASRRTGPWRVLALAGVALVGLGIGATVVDAERLVPTPVPAFVSVTGWAIVALALALPLAGLVPSRLRGPIEPVIAVLPFVLALAVYLAWRGAPEFISGFRAPLQPRDVLGYSLVSLVGTLEIAFVALVVWTALESAAAARDVVGMTIRLIRLFPVVVGTLLVGKLVWLAVGFAGRLPAELGGPVEAWRRSRSNGPVAWTMAVLLAAGAAAWLAGARRRSLPEEGWHGLAWTLAGGLTFGLGLITVGFFGHTLAKLWPGNGPLKAMQSLATSLETGNAHVWSVVVTAGLVTAAALTALWWRRIRRFAAPLLVIAAWTAPRVFGLAWILILKSEPPFRPPLLITVDAAVSVAAAVLAVMWWRGHQHAVSPGGLLLVVGVSTFLAHPGVVLPSGWTSGILFYLALGFGVMYRFVFDARSLNEPADGREHRILSAVGLAILPLTITALLVAGGLKGPGSSSPRASFVADVATVFLIVPFAAILVAGRLSDPGDEDGSSPTAAGGSAPARTG